MYQDDYKLWGWVEMNFRKYFYYNIRVLCWEIGGSIKSQNQIFGIVFYKDAQLWFWTPSRVGIATPCQSLWFGSDCAWWWIIKKTKKNNLWTMMIYISNKYTIASTMMSWDLKEWSFFKYILHGFVISIVIN